MFGNSIYLIIFTLSRTPMMHHISNSNKNKDIEPNIIVESILDEHLRTQYK